ncbi:glutathione S-transferase [Asticcacaulis biprosthecium C19]|uniref:Glutathione S-transferase n=1 Tax=Asticcacaulis biprosthecium C19 TaxID=715226 RepID=F4QKX4_9CAUL|nr:glutathione transferase GstA [Asticcacaulis biprosthecium]EGF92197.1 glutathione S-transferase [Asticcacaulis biprosthecium C19]
MKLFYAPGACSLSPHIALREAGLVFDLEKVDPAAGTTKAGLSYADINAKGYVPALRLADGEVLTEGAAIVQYIADLAPQSGLAPAAGTLARIRLQEHLNYLASEVHKAFTPLFRNTTSEEGRAAARANVIHRLDYIEQVLSDGRAFLVGEGFTVADAYLFVVAGWTKPTGIGLERWPYLQAFVTRVAQRPAVQAALQAEGLAA